MPRPTGAALRYSTLLPRFLPCLGLMVLSHPAAAQVSAAPISLDAGQTPGQAVATATPGTGTASTRPAWMDETGLQAYFRNWFRRVAYAQSQQPAWIAGLVTPPPVLVEQLRYDQYIEHANNDASIHNFGVNKGVQLIVSGTQELDIVLPAYMERYNKTPGSGFADWQAFLFKQRLLSANAQDGNYILSTNFALTAPTGAGRYTNHVYVAAPGIGFGKGWNKFDIQGSFGASLPTSRVHLYGDSLVGNLMAQYQFEKYIWPEVELNWTDWLNGTQHGGKDQLFMTVGTMLGGFKIHDRLKVAFGVGYQFALEPSFRTVPAILPTYQRNWIASLRMPF